MMKNRNQEREMAMRREKFMDFFGMGVITVLTLGGMYFSLFTESSFTGVGFLFGIAYFFLYKAVNRKSYGQMHFDAKSVGKWLKRPGIWLWLLLPAAVNLAQTAAARLIFRPFYSAAVGDEFTRIGALIPGNMTSNFLVLIPYLLILAMGEEICFRAFFQDRLAEYAPAGLAVLLSSAVFTVGHVYREPAGVMVFWVLNTFVLSLLFGAIQRKTKNAYLPTIAHFLSNYLAFVLIYALK